MGLSNNFLKNNLVFRDTGRLMGTINPNHIDLDLHCPIDGRIVKHTYFT